MTRVTTNSSIKDTDAQRAVASDPIAISQPLTLDSEALFQGAREVRIVHDNTPYRLTITRLNKLILTK